MRLCSSGTERRSRLIGNPAVKIRVGLVDDDFSVRRAVSRLLQTHGYSCSSYDSAESALNDPDFLQMNCHIVDVQLGGMNGFELGYRVDALQRQIPRIFITAHMASDLPEHPENSVLLTKPFDDEQLLALIQSSTGTVSSAS
jgi:FixJ family two-component response regulator